MARSRSRVQAHIRMLLIAMVMFWKHASEGLRIRMAWCMMQRVRDMHAFYVPAGVMTPRRSWDGRPQVQVNWGVSTRNAGADIGFV